MERLIIIKYGELTTKKGNIGYFLNTLKKNVGNFLKDENINIKFDKARMFIRPLKNNFEEIVNKLQKIFGIHEILIGYELENNAIEEISNSLIELIKTVQFKSFKVVTKRSDKSYPLTSMEISKKMGGVILKANDSVLVDVNNPEVIINIEIRIKKAYIYFNAIKGIGGYPVGSLGKGLLMLSGGIDSPVAGYLAMKRGIKVEALYFESPPHTSIQAKNKVIALARKLALYNNLEIKLHVINFTEIQTAIYKNIPHNYLITIMRRMMYRISEILCHRHRAHIIINGESIGQVASQTLTSMKAINSVVDIPVIRPVACFDKNEIIKIARDIDSFETSILPFEDCCTIFVPEHPIINPKICDCEEFEKLIPYQDLIYNAVKNKEVIIITANNGTDFENIL